MKKLKSFCSKLRKLTSLAADTCGIKVIPWRSLSPKRRLLSACMALGIWVIPFLEPQLAEVPVQPPTTLDSQSFELSGLDLGTAESVSFEPVSFKPAEYNDLELQALFARELQ